jgi:transposase
MPGRTLLPDPERLHLIGVFADDHGITLAAAVGVDRARCPGCGIEAERVHSHYVRAPADLPWQGIAVRLRLQVRRFFCDNHACARRIFAERLPGVVAPHARRTERLAAWFSHVAFALGGEAGARLLRLLGVATSGDSLLRHIRGVGIKERSMPRLLSVDDFALRRGRTYGTILVDLERERVVDLLPDRRADTFAAWLNEHPGVEVISRDRSGEYADGARRGAPGAVQVADRFHLLKNLGDAVERVLRRHATLLLRVPAPDRPRATSPPLRPDRAVSRERTGAVVRQRFAAVEAAAAVGLSTAAIARALGLHRHTVQKYRALAAAPERRQRAGGAHLLAPYEGYLLERWRQGDRNARRLWREIAAQGYPGGYRTVARFAAHLRTQARAGAPLPTPGLTPRHAAGLLRARAEALDPAERRASAQVRGLHPEIATAAALLDRFAALIRERGCPGQANRLGCWMTDAHTAGVPELRSFVVKLRQDTEAVLAGLTLPYSQGQAEGRINQLKLIKRSMYGRAGFDLLRLRVLHAAAG